MVYGFLDNGGVYTTILPPGATGCVASGINDNGDIVGHCAADELGDHIGFLATPVAAPEPSSLLFLATGLLALGTLAFRRKQQIV